MRWFLAIYLSIFCACKLDNQFFQPENVSEYQLGFETIDESRVEEIVFTSGGNTLYGIFVQAQVVANGSQTTVPTILFSHGNKDNIDNYWQRVEQLDELGTHNIFIYDYQGYGKSTGPTSLSDFRLNAQAAYAAIINRPEVIVEQIINFGFSLGAIFAIHLANGLPSVGLILESGPASSEAVVESVVELSIPGGLFFEETFDSAEEIKSVTVPKLLLHGSADEKLPFSDHGKLLFENAVDPKTTKLVTGAGHEGIPDTLGQVAYLTIIRDFLNSL